MVNLCRLLLLMKFYSPILLFRSILSVLYLTKTPSFVVVHLINKFCIYLFICRPFKAVKYSLFKPCRGTLDPCLQLNWSCLD